MRSREGCCADWPKPCSYHEGWADAEELLRLAEHGLDEARAMARRAVIQRNESLAVRADEKAMIASLRAQLERMTNHIHDLAGDGKGWWECACGYRTSTNLDQRLAAAEERTRIALDAKDYWMERATRAEAILATEARAEARSREP